MGQARAEAPSGAAARAPAEPARRRLGRQLRRGLLAAGLAALVLLPLVAWPYLTVFVIVVWLHAALATSYDLVARLGWIGPVQAAFFGLGAYGFALAARGGWPAALGLLVGALLALGLVLLVGALLLRLRGVAFGVGSLGLVVGLAQLARRAGGLTSGLAGLSVPGQADPRLAYWLALLLMAGGLAASAGLANRFSARQGRGSPEWAVLAAAAGLAGLAGGLFAWTLAYVDPDTVLGPETVLLPILMALVGGSGTLLGPTLGAVVVLVLHEWLWMNLGPLRGPLHLAVLGAVFVLVALAAPGGVIRSRPFRRLLGSG